MAESVSQDKALQTLDWVKSRLRVAFLIKIIIWILYLVLTWYIWTMEMQEKHRFSIKIFYGVLALFFGMLSVGSIFAIGIYLGVRKCFKHRNPYLFAGIRLSIYWGLWLILDIIVSWNHSLSLEKWFNSYFIFQNLIDLYTIKFNEAWPKQIRLIADVFFPTIYIVIGIQTCLQSLYLFYFIKHGSKLYRKETEGNVENENNNTLSYARLQENNLEVV